MNIYTFVFIIILHWISDFVYQDKKWAEDKHKNYKSLFKHSVTYSLVWYVFIIFLLPNDWEWRNYVLGSISFTCITFISHLIITYFSSKIINHLFLIGCENKNIPNTGAFSMIGLGQTIHYIQLILTYHFIVKLLS